MERGEVIDVLKKPYDKNINYYDYHSGEYYHIPDVLNRPEKYKPITNGLKTIGKTILGATIGATAPIVHKPKNETLKEFYKRTLPVIALTSATGGLLGCNSGVRKSRDQKFRAAISNIDSGLQKDILKRDRQSFEWNVGHYEKEQGILDRLSELDDKYYDKFLYKGSDDPSLNKKERDITMEYENLRRKLFAHGEKRNPHYKIDSELKNRAMYEALKKYHKVAASEELNSMYKQALLGGVGDGVALGSIIGGITKNYQAGGGGMTGMARVKGGMGNVTKNIGKTIAKGAMLGAAAQAGATALDNMTRPADEDEYGRRVTASEVLDEMYKEAALSQAQKTKMLEGLIGAGVGSLTGAGVGALKAKSTSKKKGEDDASAKKRMRKNILLGTLAGAGIGGAGSVAINELARSNAKKGISSNSEGDAFKHKRDFLNKYRKSREKNYSLMDGSKELDDLFVDSVTGSGKSNRQVMNEHLSLKNKLESNNPVEFIAELKSKRKKNGSKSVNFNDEDFKKFIDISGQGGAAQAEKNLIDNRLFGGFRSRNTDATKKYIANAKDAAIDAAKKDIMKDVSEIKSDTKKQFLNHKKFNANRANNTAWVAKQYVDIDDSVDEIGKVLKKRREQQKTISDTLNELLK